MIPIFMIIAAFIFIVGYIVICAFDEYGDLKFIYLMFIAFVGGIVGCLYLSYKGNEYWCEKKATVQGIEYRYGWEGCFVKEREGNYIDYDKYRVLK